MGDVWKAEDTKLHRDVALKLLASHLLRDEESRKRFHREAQAAASMSHPNVTTIHEIDEADGQTFLALEYIEGETLEQRVEKGPLPLQEALDIGRQIAEGLQAAHSKGIVHRDIKPGNVLITPDGRVKILDFGLALLTERSKLTQVDTTVGTVSYMSPEQTLGSGTDHRTDIWALGVVLYEVVTGQQPFKGDYDKAVMYSILNEEPEPITSLRTGVPMELEVLVGKCLAKAADERYKEASDVVVDIATIKRKLESGKSTVVPAARTKDALASPKAKPNRLILVGAVAAAALFCGLWLNGRRVGDTPATSAPSYKLTQLTFDAGLTFQPALSQDGNLVAYASDRAGEGNLDIWLQQRNGSQRIRLTSDPADDLEPEISPDGTRIAFRSQREPRGVYIVETLGGEPRMLAEGGRRPRFSPSGEWIAYYSPDGAFIIPASGGKPRAILEELATVSFPVWLSDETLLLRGEERVEAGVHWWAFDVAANEASIVDADPYLRGANLRVDAGSGSVRPGRYAETLGGVMVWRPGSSQTDLWLLPMDKVGSSLSPAIRMTIGTRRFSDVSSDSRGNLSVNSLATRSDIWRIPIDANAGTVRGEPEKLISGESVDREPDVSRDGALLSWISNRTGKNDAWLLDLRSGEERQLMVSDEPVRTTFVSADGRTLYCTTRGETRKLYQVDLASGSSRMISDDIRRQTDVAADGSGVLSWNSLLESRPSIFYTDSSSGQSTVIVSKQGFQMYDAQFSPDGRWIAFAAINSQGSWDQYLAPFRGAEAIRADTWIQVLNDSYFGRNPRGRWSPDGNLLYFLSDQDGFTCLWARRLQPETKHPADEPFSVQHFHEYRVSPNNIAGSDLGLSFSEDYLYLALGERTGNIWMMEPDAVDLD